MVESKNKNPLKMVADPYAGDTFVLPKTLCTYERRLWFRRTNEIIAFLMTTELAIKEAKLKYEQIISQNNYGHKWYVFVGENSELHKLAKEVLSKDKILSNKYSYLNRLKIKSILEKFIDMNKIDIIYNYAPILPVNNIPQVVRSVYSNLYFPEIQLF